MAFRTLKAGDITAVIGDNSSHEHHREGYNGVWSLTHKAEPTNLFVPAVAGLNFEHIFDGETQDDGKDSRIFFEPRRAPMVLAERSETEVTLTQAPTPTFRVSSVTTFRVKAPHYVDFTFTCRATQHVLKRGYLGLFWASYINAPEDKSMYLRRKTQWLQHCTPTHNTLSTVLAENDRFDMTFVKEHKDCLYKSFSPLRFDLPLFYGRFRNMTAAVFLDSDHLIRLTHSPSGGGFNNLLQSSNPAWDFQLVVPKYDVMIDYTLRGRLLYCPACPRTTVLDEYAVWKKELKAPKS